MIFAGVERELDDNRGTLVLVVDDRIVTPLASEISRLKKDLIGDGWRVVEVDVNWDPDGAGLEDTGKAVSDVKQAIKAIYDDPQYPDVSAVFLLGNVPVPFSGKHSPDDHAFRTLPADTYYGDVDAVLVTNPDNPNLLISQNWSDAIDFTGLDTSGDPDGSVPNMRGDGRFDQQFVPADGTGRNVELVVGRVDMSNMPAFSADIGGLTGQALEIELLRRYLTRDHDYRHGMFEVPLEGLIIDTNSNTHTRIPQLRNYTAVVGEDNVRRENWIAKMGLPGSAALFATASSNTRTQSIMNIADGVLDTDTNGDETLDADQVATIDIIAERTTHTVFNSLSGSYLMNWDKSNSLMGALLANDGYGLTAQWNFAPPLVAPTIDLYLQHMALGESIGFANQTSQGGITGTASVVTWRDLLGDPTLRMHVVEPVESVQAPVDNGNGSVTLSWSASPDGDVIGYHVYRAATLFDPFVRVTPDTPVSGPSTAVPGNPNDVYMVRAVKLEVTPSGSFYNASQGAFSPTP